MNEKEEFWCTPPFNMLVCGMTDCGKTYYILDLLENEFIDKFENIIIFCPTIIMNKTYRRPWLTKDSGVVVYSPEKVLNNLDSCLKHCIDQFKSDDHQTLFIIDDCANLWDAKNKGSQLTALAFHGRHANISVWLLTQKYNAICKDFRENCKHMVVHMMNDQNALDQIFKENVCIPSADKEKVSQHLKDNNRLVLRRKYPLKYTLCA